MHGGCVGVVAGFLMGMIGDMARGVARTLRATPNPDAFIREGESIDQAALRRAEAAIAGAGRGLPEATARGSLPPGVHQASVGELVQRFGFNHERLALLDELAGAASVMRGAGAKHIVLGGSLVDAKPIPGDIDAAVIGAVPRGPMRAALKLLDTGRVHVEPAESPVGIAQMLPGHTPGENYLEFFAHTRDGGRRGLVALPLEEGVGRELREAVRERARSM